MTGNGRGNMRPSSRSPPFLLVGLLIVSCILAFNYWSVSSKNSDLRKQLETLQFDFRSVSDKHRAVEKRASELSSQAAEYQSKVSTLQSSASEKESQASWLNGELKKSNSQLETVQLQKQQVEEQKQQVEDEKTNCLEDLSKTRRELDALQEKPVVCDCDKSKCSEVVREVLKVMLDKVGRTAVISALSPAHMDILSIIHDLLRGATDPPPPVAPVQQAMQQAGQNIPAGNAGLGAFQQQQQREQAGGTQEGQGQQQFPQDANMGGEDNYAQNNPAQSQQQNPAAQNAAGPGEEQTLGQANAGALNPSGMEGAEQAQSLGFDQNRGGVFGENANVVEMQQQQQQQQQQPQQEVSQGQVAGERSQREEQQLPAQEQNLGVFGQQAQQQQQQQQEQQQPEQQQNPDQGMAMQVNPPAQAQDPGLRADQQDPAGGEQEIVAQNIPQANAGEEGGALTNNKDTQHNMGLQDLNAAPAQEDVQGDDSARQDLPEDEMDRQAEVNHRLGGGEMSNLDENFHDQLHELSKNEAAINTANDLDKVEVDADDEAAADRAFRVGMDPDQELDHHDPDAKDQLDDGDGEFEEGPLH